MNKCVDVTRRFQTHRSTGNCHPPDCNMTFTLTEGWTQEIVSNFFFPKQKIEYEKKRKKVAVPRTNIVYRRP